MARNHALIINDITEITTESTIATTAQISLICSRPDKVVDGNRPKCGRNTMAGWIKCTTTDGTEIRLNWTTFAMIRSYPDDRGFTGSEIIFATGNPRFDHGHGETR